MSISFEEVPFGDVPWAELDAMPDRTVHQSRGWLEFLAETQRARPVVLRVLDDGAPIGWFTGATVRRYGIRILGSPMRGWTTSHMGFNLEDDTAVRAATEALVQYSTRSMRCWHLEIMDRRFDDGSVPAGFASTPLHGLEIRLDRDDAELLAGMTANGRRDVRRSQRQDLVVEEVAADDPTFAREYYDQVCQAFARRGLAPTYPLERVEALIRHVHPPGHLLLLRVRTPDGEPGASGLFAGVPGGTAWFTMQASSPSAYRWSPNEAIVWEALRRWRDRGAVRFDFGGRDVGAATDFKRKFGGVTVTTEWLRHSRLGAIESARTLVARRQRRRQHLGRVSGFGPPHVK